MKSALELLKEATNISESHSIPPFVAMAWKDWLRDVRALLESAPQEGLARYIYIVFDGPPGPESGRFIEVEDQEGNSISIGDWMQREDDYWVLRIAYPPAQPDAQAEIERLKAIIAKYRGISIELGNMGHDACEDAEEQSVNAIHWQNRAEAAEKERDELRAKLEAAQEESQQWREFSTANGLGREELLAYLARKS